MKKFLFALVLLFLSVFMLASCDKKNDNKDEVKQYAVTLTFNSEQGNATLSGADDLQKVDEGTELVLSVFPKEGFLVDSVTVNGENKTLSKGNKLNLTVEGATAIVVKFKAEGGSDPNPNPNPDPDPNPNPDVEEGLVVTVNGNVVSAEDVNDSENNKAAYKLTLAVGDVVVIKEDGEVLGFYVWNQEENKAEKVSEEFTASVAGEHTFWINNNGEIWPTEPVVLAGEITGTKNGEAVELEDVNEDAGNKAAYKLNLEVGDVVAFKEGDTVLGFYAWNNETQSSERISEEFTATVQGEHTFWINNKSEIWVTAPQPVIEPVGEITGTKNGDALELEDVKPDDSSDLAKFVLELAAGDKVAFKADDEVLGFYHWDNEAQEAVLDGTEFTATLDGEHAFYINGSKQVWVTAPQAPVEPVVLSGTKNGDALELVDVKAEDSTDLAKFVLELAAGDKVAFKADDEVLGFYHWDNEANEAVEDGEEFEAKVAGEHTFYINANKEIYVGEPQPVVQPVVLSGTKNGDALELVDVKAEDSTDLAKFVLELAAGDKVVFKADDEVLGFYHWDNEANEAVKDGEEFEAKVDGEHTFYINANKEIYVSEPAAPAPTISGTKNGDALELVDVKPEGSTDKAKFVLTLAEGDKVAFKLGDEILGFYHWDEEAQEAVKDSELFEAKVDGEHAFFINGNNEVWVTEPAAPAPSISGTKNGEALVLVDVKPEGSTDKAQFVLELALGEKVAFKLGDEVLGFYHWDQEAQEAVKDSEEFVAPADGKFVFYVNSSNQIYVSQHFDTVVIGWWNSSKSGLNQEIVDLVAADFAQSDLAKSVKLSFVAFDQELVDDCSAAIQENGTIQLLIGWKGNLPADMIKDQQQNVAMGSLTDRRIHLLVEENEAATGVFEWLKTAKFVANSYAYKLGEGEAQLLNRYETSNDWNAVIEVEEATVLSFVNLRSGATLEVALDEYASGLTLNEGVLTLAAGKYDVWYHADKNDVWAGLIEMIYFTQPTDWEHVYVYMWKGENENVVANAAWPGAEMSNVVAEDNGFGQKILGVNAAGFEKVIFNNGSSQTADLDIEKDSQYYIDGEGQVQVIPFVMPEGKTVLLSFSRSGSNDTLTDGYTLTLDKGTAKAAYYQDNTADGLFITFEKTDGSALWEDAVEATLKVVMGAGSTRDPLNNNVVVVLLDQEGNAIGDPIVLTTKIEATSGSEYSIEISDVANVYGIRIQHAKETSYNTRIYSLELSC